MSHKHIAAHIRALFHLLRMYTVGWYCASVILYFIPFLSVFYFYILSILAPLGVCILLLVPLSKSGSPRRKRRHFVPLFAKRAVSWNGETGRFPNEKSQSEISRRDPRGSPDLPRRGPSRLDADSCGSPVERRWRWWRREEGRSGWHEQDEARESGKTTEILTDSLPWFPGVLPRTTNERRSTFFYPSLLFGDARSLT